MYKDPEQREAEIKNIATVYKELADAVLPELRRARMTINYEVIGRSDEEIMTAMSAEPEKLSVEEMVYAANILAETDAQKEAIMKQTVKTYPNDYRAYNNLADIAMRKGDYTAAVEYINKALKANPNAAEANTNLGLIALKDGQIAEAEAYLAKGAASANSKEALGNLYIAQGKYNLAAQNLAGVSSNSAALAQILNKDYTAAKTTLSNIKNADATTSYLKAVLAARTGDKAGVLANLEAAKALDSSIAAKAAKDVEFEKFLK
jgi:Flp pilus assembly protein TadD